MSKDQLPERWTPRNPLGVISLFVFLIESIATVSLRAVGDKPFATILVWFIVAYPVFISSAFFLILWFKRAALFGPMDFADPGEFSRLLQDELSRLTKKLDHLEAKQDIAEVDSTTPRDELLKTVDQLLSVGDPWSAIKAASKLLKQGAYQQSLEILERVRKSVGDAHPSHFRTLATIAYNQIGLGKYEDAIQNILTVKNTTRPRNFGPWHAIALAYAYFKTHDEAQYRKWLETARQMKPDNADLHSLAQLYPEIAGEIEALA
jgi:hypothetical protein